MKHLKEINSSKISSNNDIVSKSLQDYTNLGQKKKPRKFTGKKNRLFKSLGIGAMAVFMSILTVFGTACTPKSANTKIQDSNASQVVKLDPSPLGLDPKNDPIIYTTERGLEIKYGGIDLNASLETGALQGYPYFTMGKFNGADVNWVIIGRNSDVTFFNNPVSSKLFSSWISNTYNVFAKYYAENIYEKFSPAGILINNIISSTTYIKDSTQIPLTAIKTGDSEIPSGCVLVLSETCLGESVYGSSAWYSTSTLNTYITNLLTTGLGLSQTEQNMFQPVSVTTSGATSETSTHQLFQIDDEAGFCLANYIGYAKSITTSNFWMRGGTGAMTNYSHYMDTSGSREAYMATTNSCGVRPSGVVKLV